MNAERDKLKVGEPDPTIGTVTGTARLEAARFQSQL